MKYKMSLIEAFKFIKACCFIKVFRIFIVCSLSCLSTLSYADLILFPALDFVDIKGEGEELQSITPSLTAYYTAEKGIFSVVAEGAANEEKQELERFQVGIKVLPSSTLWIGRGHTPYGYWNTQYHHGSYLDNSITAPGSIMGGMLNRHLVGLEWDSEFQLKNQASVKVEYMVGYAPKFNGNLTFSNSNAPPLTSNGGGHSKKYEDFDLLDPHVSEHDIGQTVRLSYNGLIDPENSFGIFHSNNKYKAASQFKQQSSGVFANVQWKKWRNFGEYYWIRNKLSQNYETEYAWLQSEYAQEKVTYIARFEKSSGDIPNAMFPSFALEKYVVGMRFDVLEHQAFKIEFCKSKDQNNMMRVQWTGYL